MVCNAIRLSVATELMRRQSIGHQTGSATKSLSKITLYDEHICSKEPVTAAMQITDDTLISDFILISMDSGIDYLVEKDSIKQ